MPNIYDAGFLVNGWVCAHHRHAAVAELKDQQRFRDILHRKRDVQMTLLQIWQDWSRRWTLAELTNLTLKDPDTRFVLDMLWYRFSPDSMRWSCDVPPSLWRGSRYQSLNSTCRDLRDDKCREAQKPLMARKRAVRCLHADAGAVFDMFMLFTEWLGPPDLRAVSERLRGGILRCVSHDDGEWELRGCFEFFGMRCFQGYDLVGDDDDCFYQWQRRIYWADEVDHEAYRSALKLTGDDLDQLRNSPELLTALLDLRDPFCTWGLGPWSVGTKGEGLSLKDRVELMVTELIRHTTHLSPEARARLEAVAVAN